MTAFADPARPQNPLAIQSPPQRPPRPPATPAPRPGTPQVARTGSDPAAAAALGSHWAEHSPADPAHELQKAEKQEQAQGRTASQADPAGRQAQAEASHLERQALDPAKPVTDADLQQLRQKANPQHMKPAEVLRMRGVPEAAAATLKDAHKLDAQATVGPQDPDMTGSESVKASREGRTPMTDEQKRDAVQAQASLSEDMKVGAQVRKAVDFDKAGELLAGGTGYNPSMYGDFGLKRNTEGQTSTELVATLGLDYEGSKFVKRDAKGGGMTFADDIKHLGALVIDSVMTADMLAQARVPLGHDVMIEAQKQAADLKARQAAGGNVHIPPMLETNDKGELTHAFERNRASAVDPRTGLGNSTVQHQELIREAEDGRPGEQVNVVNQEMKMKKGVDLPAGQADGHSQTQMNLVRPDGELVNVANLVPMMGPDGKTPLYEKLPNGEVRKDSEGHPVPKTRWQLNEGMAPEIKDQVFASVDRSDKAARAAWAKRKAEIDAENRALAAEGKPPKAIPEEPPPNPELERWRSQQSPKPGGQA